MYDYITYFSNWFKYNYNVIDEDKTVMDKINS